MNAPYDNSLLLDVENLKVQFKLKRPNLFCQHPILHAVDGVSFKINRGQTLGLVGESGCGKSTIGLALLSLVEAREGKLMFDGIDLRNISTEEMFPMRKRMQIVFQDPYSSLNPRQTAGDIVMDPLNIHNIGNLRDFHRLIMLLAAHVSQELNMSGLAKKIGVTMKTIQSWISILEASYIIFLLPAYHNNLGKRIVKRPKMYFYDTGLICYCTGINNDDALRKGPLDGAIFENYIVAETKKRILHTGANKELFYFRDNLGLECDLIVEDKEKNCLEFIEIKSNETPKHQMIKAIDNLMGRQRKLTSLYKIYGHLVYRGKQSGKFTDKISYTNYKSFIIR